MEQNKKINHLMTYKHGLNVNKHRRTTLLVNYYKGLADELEKEIKTSYEQSKKLIEELYLENIKIYQMQLDGFTINDRTREVKIQKYDQKQYWARRKFKTSTRRKVDENALDAALNLYDESQKVKRDDFIKSLEDKYPHKNLTENESKIVHQKIEGYDKKKNDQLSKKTQKYEMRLKKLESFKLKNQKRILEKELLNQKLSQEIDLYNQQVLIDDQALLVNFETKLETLTKQNGSKKQIEKIQKKIDRIHTILHTIEHPDVHLSIHNLKMYFGGIKAVNDLSFDVKKGEIFGLIGPNGAGKTTVFNCITQFYKATGGDAIFRNKEENIVDLYERKTHDIINEGIARSFQNVELIWELTVLDNLLVAAHSLLITNYAEHMIHSKRMQREEAVLRTKGMQILVDLGIAEYAFRSPYGLPYGILKKIELARTLMTNPTLIILDEPAAGLNDAETADLAKVIQSINQKFGITIFLVEHDMGLVMSICDTVCAISFGKKIGIGTPKEIQQNPEVRAAYLGDDSDE
ncbi:MAG: ATP-binding cassette domain-containing protein [Acholeplasmataceae bacterium]